MLAGEKQGVVFRGEEVIEFRLCEAESGVDVNRSLRGKNTRQHYCSGSNGPLPFEANQLSRCLMNIDFPTAPIESSEICKDHQQGQASPQATQKIRPTLASRRTTGPPEIRATTHPFADGSFRYR